MPRLLLLLILTGCATTMPPNPTTPAPDARAPWDAHPPVPAPAVVLDEWRAAENRARCAPLTLAGVEGTPRRANFSGGWGIAWDVPGKPGREPSGASCETCGRGVYGIAGAGTEWMEDDVTLGFDHSTRWEGENFAGYGPEGGTGPNWLAQIRVADQPCVYYVWSFLGREHLRQLIGQVRRAQT